MQRCALCTRVYFPVTAGCQNQGCASFGQVTASGKASVEPMTPPPTVRPEVVRMPPSSSSSSSSSAPSLISTASKGPPAYSSSSSPASSSKPSGENWRDRDARLERERVAARELALQKKAAMIETIEARYPAQVIVRAPDMYFRASGVGQQPWDLLNNGFVHRTGTRTASELKAYLVHIYGKQHGGARSYMTNYRASASNNPGNAPFISAGPLPNDGQGASNAYWQIALRVPGLQEIAVNAELLGCAADVLSDDIGDVKLMISGNDFDTATTRVLIHGPLPECTWLSHARSADIVAWIRMGGEEWQRKWRTFDVSTVNGIRQLTLENGMDIAQPA